MTNARRQGDLRGAARQLVRKPPGCSAVTDRSARMAVLVRTASAMAGGRIARRRSMSCATTRTATRRTRSSPWNGSCPCSGTGRSGPPALADFSRGRAADRQGSWSLNLHPICREGRSQTARSHESVVPSASDQCAFRRGDHDQACTKTTLAAWCFRSLRGAGVRRSRCAGNRAGGQCQTGQAGRASRSLRGGRIPVI